MKALLKRLRLFLFENRNARQTIAKNAFWITVGQFGSRLIRALVVIYAARVMGAADYGVFSYGLGLAGFFTPFADMGVGQILTRESAKNPEARSHYFSTIFWIKTTLLVFTGVIIITIVPYFSRVAGVLNVLPFIALLVIFDGLRELASSFFRALEKMEREAFVTILTNLFITISGFIVLHFTAKASVFTIAYAFSVGLGMLAALLIIRKEFYKVFSHAKRELIKPVLSSAIPLTLSMTIGAFMLNTDFVMLGWWQTPEQIGFYSAGQKIVMLLLSLPSVIAIASFPALSKLIGDRDHQRAKTLMEKGMTMIFLIALPLTVGGIILGKNIIDLVYGGVYLPSTLNFQVLMTTALLYFPFVFINNAAVAYDKQKQTTKYLLLAAIANALFDALLIPRFGIVGSSIATIIALSLNLTLSWHLVKKVNDFRTLPHLVKVATASIMMGTITFFLSALGLNVIVNILISTLIYFGLLFAMKEQALNEVRIMLRAIS